RGVTGMQTMYRTVRVRFGNEVVFRPEGAERRHLLAAAVGELGDNPQWHRLSRSREAIFARLGIKAFEDAVAAALFRPLDDPSADDLIRPGAFLEAKTALVRRPCRWLEQQQALRRFGAIDTPSHAVTGQGDIIGLRGVAEQAQAQTTL